MDSSPPIPDSDLVYLDHHASTPLLPEVLETMNPWLERGYGNPSNSLHEYGKEAAAALEWARQQVAALVNCAPREILFTSGATEANNLAVQGHVSAMGSAAGIAYSSLEHESVVQPANYLQKRGLPVCILKTGSDGRVDPDMVHRVLDQNQVSLVSVIAVQGEIGSINPVAALTEVAHHHGVLFHTDAAQAVGKIPVDVQDLGVDLLTIAGHKMYAPKGVGALYCREGISLKPILYGAGHERGMRSGTENVPLLVGFGEACRQALRDLEDEADRQQELRNNLWEQLRENIPDIRLNGRMEHRHPGNLHFSLQNLDSRVLLQHLPGYALSVGSACHSDRPEENPLIRALDIPREYAMGSVRIGIGRSNTAEEIQAFARDFIEAWEKVSETGGG